MKAITVALVIAGLLLGMRIMIGWGQRVDCGGRSRPAFWLSVQALGAAPSATHCLALSLSASRPTSPPAPKPLPVPPPTTTDPRKAINDWAFQRCWDTIGDMDGPPGPWAECLRNHGYVP